jgi:hypothetical protein
MSSLLERHGDQILGVISCFDRVIIHGTLPGICYAGGMTSYLYRHKIRIFDYPHFAQELRDEVRSNAERVAKENSVQIEFVRKASFSKEKRIKQVLAERGTHPGLVHILSAMEGCAAYKPWHDKKTHKTYVRPDSGQCLHYYFYFIDAKYGLCYLRVPTWCPFRLQFYFNGHNRLAAALDKAGIDYQLVDNAFTSIADFDKAQRLANDLDTRELHRLLDGYARRCCPVISRFNVTYHWSLMQVEYATDIVFGSRDELQPLYEAISRTAVLAVKADKVATFLGRKGLHPNFSDELGNDFNTRIQGTRVKHHMGPASIKMYDKYGRVLRIETTTNDVSFFRHHRMVEHRDCKSSFKVAPLRKTIFSLHDLRGLLAAANKRYLDFISDIEDPTAPTKLLDKVSRPVSHGGRRYKGFNFFADFDQRLFEVILRGEHTISGMRNRDIRRTIPELSAAQVSRHLKRLRTHGLIKRVGRTYKYYLTKTGRTVALAGLKLRSLVLIPELARMHPS